MATPRWMDLDGSWVYSRNPGRQPDNLMKYSTLPGRSYDNYRAVTDISRRSADDRGKYGTIPGRYLHKAPVRGQSPYRLWSATRLPQGPVLQDSTNWGSNLPPIHRGSTLGRMEQNTDRRSDARIKEQFHYKWDNNIADTFAAERKYEKKRQKLPGEPYGERTNYSPSGRQRQKGKLIQMDSIYGKWEADYILEKKMKELKYDEWEPLYNLPKALQNQLLSQTGKVDYPEIEKIQLAMTNYGDASPEKRSWWSKLVKSAKSGVTNPAISETSQDKANKIYVEQSSSVNHKQEVLKENRPQLRKRKVPPPYVPPPSYDYPHRIFPINKEKANHNKVFGQKPSTPIQPLHDIEDSRECREKVPRYSVENTRAAKTNVTSSTNKQENKVEAEEKQKFDPALQSAMQGRKLPQAHNTWTGPNSDEFLDHIYESVEGRSSPLTHNIPNFPKAKSDLDLQPSNMIYGSVSFPLQRDASIPPYTLYTSRKGIHEGNEATRRKNMATANNRQREMPPFDIRPPIPLHGVRLPRELGFSYASGNFQNVDKKIREEYINLNKQESESEPEWRRPLRVVSSKESRARGPPRTSTNKIDYGRYSHTLPLKKQYMKPYSQEETKQSDSRKPRIPYQDTEFPRWREPGNVNTLPGRSRDHSRWRSPDGVKYSKKHHTSEQSNMYHSDLGKSQAKEVIPEKVHPALSNDGEGLFVIDATCVVVRAEYIFPPVMEQVKFVPNEKSKGESLTIRGHPESLSKRERAPHSTSHSKPSSNLPLQPFPQKHHSNAQHFNRPSTERQASNLKERAVRILGLSIGELDYFNDAQDQLKPNRYQTEAVNAAQGPTFKEPQVLSQNGYNRKESKIQNSKELPCILEDIDLLPATSVTGSDIVHASDNATEEFKELGTQQDVLIPNIQKTSSNENISEPSNITGQNDPILATPLLEESHLPTESCIGMRANPSVASHCMELEATLNQQTQEKVETIASEQNSRTLAEPSDIRVPENVKQDGEKLVETVEECLVKKKTMSMVTGKRTSEEHPISSMNAVEDQPMENQSKEKNGKSTKHTPTFTKSQEEPDAQLRQTSSDVYLGSQGDDTFSSRRPMKVYSRRPNYYAKDLREAVSRIRRHTAPDSDTDEDLEKPSSDSAEQVSGEGVTSCSSDTSDSEVTVILCETEKEEDTLPIAEDTDNEGMNAHSEDGFTKELEVAETSQATLCEGEVIDQSSLLQVPEQEAVYDLSSCIKEILQDLNKTEQEFFSSNEDQRKVSASPAVPDLLITGNCHTNPDTDMESSVTE